MKRLFVGGMVLVSILVAASFLSLIFVSADNSWEMGDLARVARRLGVEPRPDGKYDLSSVLTAVLDRLPAVPESAVEPIGNVSTDVRTLTIQASPWYAGTTTPGAGTWTFDAGTWVSLSAAPAAGYQFDHWEGDLSGRDSSRLVMMGADKRVTAVFVTSFAASPLRSTLALHVWPPRGGTTVPIVGTAVYDADTTVDVTARPTAGYRFDHWEGDLCGEENPASLTMDADRDVTAVFMGTVQIVGRDIESSPGAFVTLRAQTIPDAYCQVEVYLPSGDRSTAEGLEPTWAGSDGFVSWTWRVDWCADPGIGQIIVTATSQGETCEDRVPWAVWNP